ncbi:hypothetical protein EVAR_36795_1 [Eumeta japonica]|uniref:Uncharacterized protein n=1 Tax=Eumeta variegata TaxID=151549 RepID=A0A4C1WX36_EUMVA|nr:hypothetical protein EVAR_36795_1 [Eumeta japonica]
MCKDRCKQNDHLAMSFVRSPKECVLAHYFPEIETVPTVDMDPRAMGAALSQRRPDGVEWMVSCTSLSQAELNYEQKRVNGSSNVADYLSRHSGPPPASAATAALSGRILTQRPRTCTASARRTRRRARITCGKGKKNDGYSDTDDDSVIGARLSTDAEQTRHGPFRKCSNDAQFLKLVAKTRLK